MIGVIMSRTMLGKDICFSIHDYSTDLQIRPVTYPGNLKFDFKSQKSMQIFDAIWPKTKIKYTISEKKPIPRITHPEDVILKSKVTILEPVSENEFHSLIQRHFHSSIYDFIPQMKVSYKKAYIEDTVVTKHSVGYIHAKRIVVYKETNFNKIQIRVFILDDTEIKIQAPLKDAWQHKFFMENIKDEEYVVFNNVILRLSIADSFNPSLQWRTGRCYLQVSRIEFQ